MPTISLLDRAPRIARRAPYRTTGHATPSRVPVLLPVLLLGVAGAAAGVLTLPAGPDGGTSGSLQSGGASGVTALGPTARAAIPTSGPLLNLSTSRNHELASADETAAQGPAAVAAGAARVVVVPPPASTSPLARSRSEAPALATPRTTADGRQVLGSKAALLAAAAPSVVAPVAGPVSSPFGYRWGRLHAGLDFAVPVGSPVVAAMDGVVQRTSSSHGGYGNLTVLVHADGTLTYYAHQSAILVTDGQVVTAGELIGQSGNTGHSTGPHLHFEVRSGGGDAIDPRTWLAEQGVLL